MNNLAYFIPDIILILGLIMSVCLAVKAFRQRTYIWFLNTVLVFMLLGFLPFAGEFAKFAGLDLMFSNIISLPPVENYTVSLLNNSAAAGPLSVLFKFLITLSAFVVSVLSTSFVKKLNHKISKFTPLFLFAILGGYGTCAANDFISLFISLEILTMALYFLIACFSSKEDKSAKALEGSFKYFITGEIASCFMLFGISYIYLSLGTVNFSEINLMMLNNTLNYSPVLSIGEIIFFTSLVFKIGAFPFYMWVMDVFKGSDYSVGLFIATTVKLTAAMALVKTVSVVLDYGTVTSFALILSAIITLILGNHLALRIVKKDGTFKEFLASSSIANIGYVFLGIAFLSKGAILAAVFYLLVYLIANFGLWAVVMLFVRNLRKEYTLNGENIGLLRGISYISPFFSTTFAVCLLSFAGFPPMAGFTAKFYLFSEILNNGIRAVYPLLFAAFASILAVYYYFKIIHIMYLKPETKIYKKNPPKGLVFNRANVYTVVLSISAALLIILFFASGPVLNMLNAII